MSGQLCRWPKGAVSEHAWRNCHVYTRRYLAIDEEFAAATALADAKTYVNVELAEKTLIVEAVKTVQNAKSKSALNK
jgi:hypothetical protein